MHKALYYQPHEQGIRCMLCPKNCVIGEGRTGFCRVRKNAGGTLYTENYAACSACALDPIEKKPLYHFYPGSTILSLGTWGCNFACQFCQNWQIAQGQPKTVELLPTKAVEVAEQYKQQKNIGIAYTYSEPSVWYEYILDTAQLVRQAGLKNVLVTNGYINEAPLRELLVYVDAMNIDVKAFSNRFYKEVCAGHLEDVKRTVELAATQCHVEITTLLVPGLNDSEDELKKLVSWLAGISKDIPLHVSRYFPNYKMDLPATPEATMIKAYEIAREQLHYVYLGNMSSTTVNTQCAVCGGLVIDRINRESHLTENKKCPQCGSTVTFTGDPRF